jgi:hypothetical protein
MTDAFYHRPNSMGIFNLLHLNLEIITLSYGKSLSK